MLKMTPSSFSEEQFDEIGDNGPISPSSLNTGLSSD